MGSKTSVENARIIHPATAGQRPHSRDGRTRAEWLNSSPRGHRWRRTRSRRRCRSERGPGPGTCRSGSTTRGVHLPRSPSWVTRKEATSAASRASSGAVPTQTSSCQRERTNRSSSSCQAAIRSDRSVGANRRGAGRPALLGLRRSPLAGSVVDTICLPNRRPSCPACTAGATYQQRPDLLLDGDSLSSGETTRDYGRASAGDVASALFEGWAGQ